MVSHKWSHLGEVARINEAQGASQINRRNLYREVLFSANVMDRPAGDVGADMREVASQMKLPAGYRFQIQGQNKDMEESLAYAKTALILAVLFIYFVLGAQFNSFIHPLTIMSSLPLSLVGVFLALFLFKSTLNIFSIIGIVMLMGLVTKNAILLVDFIQQAVKEGMNREQAILVAGRTRLRPILMTTAAMVVGMLPLALGLGEGSEQRAPMAHALIGGVLTSTLLTLVVVPVLYTVFDDLAQVFKAKKPNTGIAPQGLKQK
jgi:HAE1 family hydrophobic/amphiphilic exporter-1